MYCRIVGSMICNSGIQMAFFLFDRSIILMFVLNKSPMKILTAFSINSSYSFPSVRTTKDRSFENAS